MGQQVNVERQLKFAPGAIITGAPGGFPGTDYYVDDALGNSANSGLAWGAGYALATISQAMTKVTALATRGRARIFVAPGGYTEDVVTPTNDNGPFGSLIAVNPTQESRGAAWLISSTATEPGITVKARGWVIDGFEIDAPATDGCVFLSGANAKFLEIANVLFVGSLTYASGFGVDTDSANPLVVIRDSTFFQFRGTSAAAITSTNVYALQWLVDRCVFWNNINHIAPKNSKGWQASVIRNSTFHKYMSDTETTIKIDPRGGAGNMISHNVLGGAYTNAGGYYSVATDQWFGNAMSTGFSSARPS
ncbi:hypothetical protein LCGC14_3101480 [marine sediment metagenome]|uniref:Right handed beta helix domain-containing protein n=1 Tax=marine sediment metagenome TaxID=412755 RepID=A0A0F8YF55_9ZZZZ